MKKLIILLLLLVGCKAKVNTVETHTIDTLMVKEILTVSPSTLNELVIENPCDSLGQLKPINYTLGTGNDKVTAKTIDNQLVLTQEKKADTTSQKETYKTHQKTEFKETIIFKTPAWNWKVMGISILLNSLLLAYTFRRFIPFLKFLP